MDCDVGLDLFVKIEVIGEGIRVAAGLDEAIQVLALGMRRIGVAGITIDEDRDAEVQRDQHFPLGVSDSREVPEFGPQTGLGFEKGSVLVRHGEVFSHGVVGGDGAGIPSDEVDEHTAGFDELGQFQDGIGSRLGEVRLMDHVTAAPGEGIPQTETRLPEVGGGAGQEDAEWMPGDH